MLSLKSCKVGHSSDDNNELILYMSLMFELMFFKVDLIPSELLYVESFEVCLFDFGGKDPK